MNIWTATALASEAKPWRGSGWRAVESQHKITTLGLVHGSLNDQAILEEILEQAKPPIPPQAQGLHWLLSTPFRYYPLSSGSRFRRNDAPGVFYGAEDRKTACAETGYWRLQMWRDSQGLATQQKTVALTLFEFHAATHYAIDLTMPPLNTDRAMWMDAKDYTATQQLAEDARTANIELIRYESVRHQGGYCLALLSPQVFRAIDKPFAGHQQSWRLHIKPPHLTIWQRDITHESWEFDYT